MSSYSQRARENWEMLCPSRASSMSESEQAEFYLLIGQAAEEAAHNLIVEMRRKHPMPAEMPYLQRVGHLNALNAMVDEIIQSEYLTPPEAQWEEGEEEIDEYAKERQMYDTRRQQRILDEAEEALEKHAIYLDVTE